MDAQERRRTEEERAWQTQKSLWFARDVYRVERTMWLAGLVLGLPILVVLALCLGWVVISVWQHLGI
jgi:hypothetical protein